MGNIKPFLIVSMYGSEYHFSTGECWSHMPYICCTVVCSVSLFLDYARVFSIFLVVAALPVRLFSSVLRCKLSSIVDPRYVKVCKLVHGLKFIV